MSEKSYYQRNKEVILNRAKRYYESNIERLREHARNKYRKSSEKEKYIKREYGRNRYKNMSEENKQRPKEYRKNYRKTKNSNWIFFFFFLHSIRWKKPWFSVNNVLIKINFICKESQLIFIV